MLTNLYWGKFADVAIRKLVNPEAGQPLIVLADTTNDLQLAEALLSAAENAGADAQLIIKTRSAPGMATKPGPVLSNAFKSAKYIVSICDDGFDASQAIQESISNGTRILITKVDGIEEYVLKAILDVDIDTMIKNANLCAKLWESTKVCKVTCPNGTNISFNLSPRKTIIGDGALTRDGEIDFFPGAQVNIAPVEETINGTIVVDGSDNVNGLVLTPYKMILKNGIITNIEGDSEGNKIKDWLEACNQENIYHLCHFTIGLNPEAGISGNLVEDERKVAAVDFGFGYQSSDFGGTVGSCDYHMDVVISTPSIFLDGKEMSGRGKFNSEMGFKNMVKPRSH
jgi:2,5-dihydroxypyridine 5,6-dioxygenase|tara:strand:- start:975 stop:1997 length:1023 start_codon:yes stop_codon:yes gene_type:complete